MNEIPNSKYLGKKRKKRKKKVKGPYWKNESVLSLLFCVFVVYYDFELHTFHSSAHKYNIRDSDTNSLSDSLYLDSLKIL